MYGYFSLKQQITCFQLSDFDDTAKMLQKGVP